MRARFGRATVLRDVSPRRPSTRGRARAASRMPLALGAPRRDFPTVRYSTTSGRAASRSIRTRIGVSVPFDIWCAPAAPRGNATTSPSPKLVLALGRAQRGPPPENDEPLLVGVMRVVRPEPVAGLELVHAAADELGVDVRADPRILAAPSGPILRAIPFVAVQVEDLHGVELMSRAGRDRSPSARRGRPPPRRRAAGRAPNP